MSTGRKHFAYGFNYVHYVVHKMDTYGTIRLYIGYMVF